MNTKKVVIAGGSGTIGTALGHDLQEHGYEVCILSRKPDPDSPFKSYQWLPGDQFIEEGALDDTYAVVNLTGAPLDGKRWTTSYKKTITKSRIDPAIFLRKEIAKLPSPPGVYIGASAIGIYGDRGEEVLTEKDTLKDDSFLVKLAHDWEAAHLSGDLPGTRSAILRFGLILTTKEGFLPELLKPARFGAYPYFGDGSMWQSWIHIDDITGMVRHVMESDGLAGEFNAVAPNPERLKALAGKLRQAKGSPGLAGPVPKFILKIMVGEMAEILFYSARVSAQKISDSGYCFEFDDASSALEDLVRA